MSATLLDCDFLIVGAGIAGASIGHFLAPHGRTIVLERESQPGYHSTGRSAALFLESYGTAQVRALTRASRAFLEAPPEGFAEGAILSPRGALFIAARARTPSSPRYGRCCSRSARAAACSMPAPRASSCRRCATSTSSARCSSPTPPTSTCTGCTRASCAASGAHGGRSSRDAERHGHRARRRRRLAGRRGRPPLPRAGRGRRRRRVGDHVAALAGVAPIGLRAEAAHASSPSRRRRRRHARAGRSSAASTSSWYVKPDAGLLLGSPANADPVAPQDVQPEELDIALAIDRIEAATTLAVRPRRTWAGLRSFVADGDLVGGFDADAPGFFWLAGAGRLRHPDRGGDGRGVRRARARPAAAGAHRRLRPRRRRARPTGLRSSARALRASAPREVARPARRRRASACSGKATRRGRNATAARPTC